MKLKSFHLLLSAAVVTSLMAVDGQRAFAGTSYNGWNYAIDSFNDGTEGWLVGDSSKFEFYGLAYKETANQVIFAANSNLSLAGYAEQSAKNGTIGYGDLMLNFANPNNFDSANGNLYGIRFDQNNDTQVGLGLYKNVTATSVAGQNDGYTWQGWHTMAVNDWIHGQASLGDLAEGNGSTYFNSAEAAPNSIATGTYVGALNMINDFSKTDLDFAHFNATGTYTFGFSVDKSLLPAGNFIASLFAECGNDGVALAGDLTKAADTGKKKDVPEPSFLVGLATVGALMVNKRRKSKAIAQ